MLTEGSIATKIIAEHKLMERERKVCKGRGREE